nr:alpha-S2-casein [Equus asinus]
MKFFIITCLLAVALAKHESTNISQEKYKQDNNVAFQTSQESSSGSSSEETTDSLTDKIELTKEEKLYLKQLEKEHHSSSEEFTSISQEKTSKKTVDMGSTEIFPEEIELSDEEKNYLKQLVKINPKFPSPQYFQAVHPQQIPMSPWNRIKENTYPFIITLRNF